MAAGGGDGGVGGGGGTGAGAPGTQTGRLPAYVGAQPAPGQQVMLKPGKIPAPHSPYILSLQDGPVVEPLSLLKEDNVISSRSRAVVSIDGGGRAIYSSTSLRMLAG